MIDLYFDTETTGFKREDFTPEIVQIAAILQDGKNGRILAEINLIVTPHSYIPDEVAAIHGITTDIARDYGFDQHEAQSLFYRLLQRCDRLVAHNIEFDLEMVHDNWFEAWLLTEEKQKFDTMRELTPIMKLPKDGKNHYHDDKYPEWKAPRLQEAYEYFYGNRFENAHDAMADVRALRMVHMAMTMPASKRAKLRKIANAGK